MHIIIIGTVIVVACDTNKSHTVLPLLSSPFVCELISSALFLLLLFSVFLSRKESRKEWKRKSRDKFSYHYYLYFSSLCLIKFINNWSDSVRNCCCLHAVAVVVVAYCAFKRSQQLKQNEIELKCNTHECISLAEGIQWNGFLCHRVRQLCVCFFFYHI